MGLISLREYSRSHDVSYENTRAKISRYAKDLDGHIITQKGARYLDDFAVSFLDDHKRQKPVIVTDGKDPEKEIADLREQLEDLKARHMAAQEELVKTKNELLTDRQKIIELQEEGRLAIETKVQNEFLREQLTDTREQLADAREQLAETREQIDKLQTEVSSYRPSWFGFYRRVTQ